MQPCCTPFPILNQLVFSCLVLLPLDPQDYTNYSSPPDTIFLFSIPAVICLLFCFFLWIFGSIFHSISLPTPRNMPFGSILNTFCGQQTNQSHC